MEADAASIPKAIRPIGKRALRDRICLAIQLIWQPCRTWCCRAETATTKETKGAINLRGSVGVL